MHSMLNIVTEAEDFPAAVLIRAVEPMEGLDIMRVNRQGYPANIQNLTNGPAKLCQALAIDKALNNWDVTLGQELWVEFANPVAEAEIGAGPRRGIDYAQPQDRVTPWRFWIKGNRFVSK
jgi:DNA-3-methyladenine glycosylase